MSKVPYWVFNERSLNRAFSKWSQRQQASGAKPAQIDFIQKAMLDLLKSPEAIDTGIVHDLAKDKESKDNHD